HRRGQFPQGGVVKVVLHFFGESLFYASKSDGEIARPRPGWQSRKGCVTGQLAEALDVGL
ncbi:MAG: hypothetical protein M1436_07885, partial [Acidobacteria bacterium]|nr:hypothetical protein [Acidobacteriota bacterium]